MFEHLSYQTVGHAPQGVKRKLCGLFESITIPETHAVRLQHLYQFTPICRRVHLPSEVSLSSPLLSSPLLQSLCATDTSLP